jgi:hypothetical protein
LTTGLNPDCGMIRIMPALEARLIKVDAMGPIKANLPSRHCDKCKAEMTHLSDLPSYLGASPVRIFRCYVCNNVVSENR